MASDTVPAHIDIDSPTSEGPGFFARPPWNLSVAEWKSVIGRVWEQRSEDDVSVHAAAVAFSAMFAIPTLLIAVVSLYGVFATPDDVLAIVERADSVLPDAARDLITSQLQSIVSQNDGALSAGAALGFATAIWSVSGGVNRLRETIVEVYDGEDARSWYIKRAWAAAAAVGVIAAIISAVFLIGVLPSALDAWGIGGIAATALNLGRWVVLGTLMFALLGALYRYGPTSDPHQRPWISVGAIVAVFAWLLMSIGFGIYVQNFGSYNETYGSLGSVIVFMMWLYLSAYIVLMAGEVNSELQRQWRERA